MEDKEKVRLKKKKNLQESNKSIFTVLIPTLFREFNATLDEELHCFYF
jgi:hypothetical protein